MQNKDEFLNIIKLRIDDKASKNKRLEYLKKKIESKKATFADTAEYSEIISNITGSTFSSFVPKINSSGTKGYICEELLKSRYADINAVMSEVQKSLDEKAGINIAPQQADFPIDRVRKVASSLEDMTVNQDVIERRADSSVSNVSKSFHDDYIQENAEFRSDAGIKCTITRTALGKCCAWCDAVCGTYVYGEEPEGIYRRHDNCSCEVIFENGRTVQDVWSKKTWEKPSGSNDYKPTSFSAEQAKALQDKNMPKPFTNDNKSGIIKENNKKTITQITDIAIENVPKVDISGYTNEECVFIQQQHKELLKYSRDNNECNEVAFLFNSSMSYRNEFIGSDRELNFENSLYGDNLILLHNHPRNSSYSLNDIVEFISNRSIKTLTIVKNNGGVESLTKISEYDELSMLKELRRLEKKNVKVGSDNEFRNVVDKFLTKSVKGGVIEWKN